MTGASEYLIALYVAEHQQDPPVSSGVVADELDRSSAAATEMLQRLADDGLVTYEPYEGATLTETGREEAEQLHQTYVTLSWFFRSVLDLDDHEEMAMRLAGTVSLDVVERLATTLPYDDDGESSRLS